VLYVGFECNAKCRFCYFAELDKEQRKWKPLTKLKQEASMFRNVYNNKSVDITGGEPTIYPEIVKLVEFCDSIGLKPTIITNGIRTADKKFLGELKKARLRDLLISVQGYKTKMTKITGVKGHYKKILETFKNCNELGIPFRINCVIHKLNYQDLDKIARLVCKHGAKVVNFIVFNPYYKWTEKNKIDFQAQHSEISPYLSKAINEVEKQGIECNVRYLPFCFLPKEQRHTIMNWMQLSYDKWEWDASSWHRWTNEMQLSLLLESGFREVFSTNKYDALYNTFALRIRRQLYVKPSTCAGCFAKNICDGLTKQYFARFGQYELEPIKDMFETKDPLYYKIEKIRGEKNDRKGKR